VCGVAVSNPKTSIPSDGGFIDSDWVGLRSVEEGTEGIKAEERGMTVVGCLVADLVDFVVSHPHPLVIYS
jgi:hypothetical protein